ncbi:hypothetical protein OROMI_002513 [Orobanche minor]
MGPRDCFRVLFDYANALIYELKEPIGTKSVATNRSIILPTVVLTMASDDRSWMDNRKVIGMRGCTEEFTRGVKYFVEFARLRPECIHDGMFRCPCYRCRNLKVESDGVIKLHLMKFGFVDNYKRWILHGEPRNSFRDVQRRLSIATNSINESEA